MEEKTTNIGGVGQAKFIQRVPGEFLKRIPVKTEIKLILFRNDSLKDAPLFQIQLELPQGRIFTLMSLPEGKIALREYAKISKSLKLA